MSHVLRRSRTDAKESIENKVNCSMPAPLLFPSEVLVMRLCETVHGWGVQWGLLDGLWSDPWAAIVQALAHSHVQVSLPASSSFCIML